MALRVVSAPVVAANTPFTITVPGQEVWTIWSVFAVCARAVGGTPNRAYQLAVTDETSNLVVSPAADVGTEPGTCSVTWTDGSPSSVASGATGISLGPLGKVVCPSGYRLIGTVLNGVAADQWTTARAWVDVRAT